MKYYCSNNSNIETSPIHRFPGNLSKTLKKLQPGDVCIIYSGVYIFNDTLNINCSGTKENKIQIIGEGDVEFDFSDMPYQDYCKENLNNGINVYGNYLELKNISIKYSPFRGLQCFGHHNIFENIETSYNCDCGFMLYNGNNIVKKCYSHHNLDYRLYKDDKEHFGFNSDGFADKLFEGEGNEFIDCLSEYNGDDGFDFFQRVNKSEKYTKLKNCIAQYNGLYEIDLSQNKRLLKDPTISKDVDLKAYHNYGNGMGFKLGGLRPENISIILPTNNIQLDNCKSLYNRGCGFHQNKNTGKIILNNCEYIGNREDFHFSSKHNIFQIIIENFNNPNANQIINCEDIDGITIKNSLIETNKLHKIKETSI